MTVKLFTIALALLIGMQPGALLAAEKTTVLALTILEASADTLLASELSAAVAAQLAVDPKTAPAVVGEVIIDGVAVAVTVNGNRTAGITVTIF